MSDPLTITITIDDRAGSDHAYLGHDRERISLSDFFRSHRTKPEVRILRLPAGDFCFSGEGPRGPALIGIERKTIKDMLSSMRTGRFSGEQLPKLFDQYDYSYLVVEGQYRTDWQSGVMEEPHAGSWRTLTIGQQHFVSLELESFMNSVAIKSPLRVRRTRDFRETVEYVMGLAHTFSKPWDRHTAHAAIHSPEPFAMVEKASTVRRVAFALAGVGWVRSGSVEQRFSTVAEMVAADVKDWAGLDGFGPVLSRKVFNELHGNGRQDA